MEAHFGSAVRLASILAITGVSVGLTPLLSTPLIAQQVDGELSVQGTMAFNGIWNTANTGGSSRSTATGLRLGEGRYSGRVAVRIRSGVYVGASVSSWQFNLTPLTGYDAVSEAVDLAPYVQLYPLRHTGLFLRGGAGYVRSWAYFGAGNIIQGYKGSRLSGSAGIGCDFALRAHLALTLSGDYTKVANATNYAEGKSAVMIGVGLTVH
ncbi:MAG TPA: hypothetical protein VGL65_06965 [Gemmatimonadales bacterium]|jgi:hypothetical protein